MGDLQQTLLEVTFALNVQKGGGSVTVSQQPGDAVYQQMSVAEVTPGDTSFQSVVPMA